MLYIFKKLWKTIVLYREFIGFLMIFYPLLSFLILWGLYEYVEITSKVVLLVFFSVMYVIVAFLMYIC